MTLQAADVHGEGEISIHTLRGEGDAIRGGKTLWQARISIHTLRMEGDLPILRYVLMPYISIHTLRMEGDGRINLRCA